MQIEKLRELANDEASLFAGLSDADLVLCAEKFEEIEVLAGTTLTRQGDFSYRFFVVLEGEVEVLRDFEKVATIAGGDCFGELGVASDGRRNARVVASVRSRVASIIGWEFREMCDQVPALGERVQAIIDLRSG